MPAPKTGSERSRERPLRRDAERNRRRILDAAKAAFAERGLDATMDEIARRTGVGVGTVYRRFPDKQLLIDELFAEELGEIVALAEEGLGDEDPWRGWVGFLEAALARVASDRGLSQLLAGNAPGRDRLALIRERIVPITDELLRRAQEAGAVRSDLAGSDLPLFSIMVRAIADYTQNTEPEAWRRLLTILLDGIRVRRTAPSPLPVDPLSLEQIDVAMRAYYSSGARPGRPPHRPG